MMEEKRNMTRRSMLARTVAVAGAASLLPTIAASADEGSRIVKTGRIRQSICRGCLSKSGMSVEQMAAVAAEMGLAGLDLVQPKDWDAVKKHGLVATMVPGAGSIKSGLNDKSLHPKFMEEFSANIKAAAAAGWPNVITMAGDRQGISDEEGMENCTIILKEAVKIAEDHGVTICMELLNSKVDHPGYMCDNTAWGFELCRRVGSPHFKMLYDIYHMQVMEGDLIATIRKNIDHIGHFHTAGVPGRHEIDEDQEIQYPAVMRAIVDTGYSGYVAHEYTPLRDPLTSLRQAVQTCDV
ncbi:TIM barrel protein [candidate division KSB1 bacterium]|nr:TIM barrel protein [candidate division KSB1 bacterium]RQW02467.1 MAG: hydroxypyruvate isomerase [candidate division KSB1 bacterium]